MISSFRLKFGRAPGIEAESIETTAVTVFVGPNNSGKSKILSEIQGYCSSGELKQSDVILQGLTFFGINPGVAASAIKQIQMTPGPNQDVRLDDVMVGAKNQHIQVPYAALKQAIENPAGNLAQFCQWFLRYNTLMLDGQSRIGLVAPQEAGDLQRPRSSLQVLFTDDIKRHEVRRIVKDAFEQHFVIDPSFLGQLRIRLSSVPPPSDMEERGLHKEAFQFHRNAQLIESASDGVKAFTGIITELISGDPRVILIDEPEAFLHPSLAFKLGYEVSRAALSAEKRVFASTHSPYFVMGCVQSGAPLNIVRLTYRSGIATARVLPSSEILELMRNPLSDLSACSAHFSTNSLS